ncbi:MAG: hypothetical protein NC819_02385 [Candidatus Omnitrophica bacterium]|nr:hypothetical protein [Candidatus Omnitrophota bacterium]
MTFKLLLYAAAGILSIASAVSAEEQRKPIIDPHQIIREAEKKRWEHLQQTNQQSPEDYQANKAALIQRMQIDEIIDSFQQGAISQAEAEQRLYPLIQGDIQSELSGIDEKIRLLEEKLRTLQEEKANPDLMARRKIRRLLGVDRRDPSELLDPASQILSNESGP